ncbi:MAG: hypothetical protein IIA67_09825, partial [Planctomycetes bacterium]|nr:hypothetical protein [Planctomycetota bacterium]
FVLLLSQIGLGAGAWVTKFGFPSSGYVAVQHSAEQLLLRTSHAVVGILLFMTSVIYALRVFRLDWLNRNRDRAGISTPALAAALPANGGAA